jgi:MFS family permease
LHKTSIDPAGVTSPTGPREPGRLLPAWTPVASRRTPLLGLLAANVISVLGGAMSLVALPWFVFETTNSAALTGVAALCETAPVVAVSLATGGIVARFGARRTRIWSDLVAGVTVVTVPALYATVGVAYWQLLLLVAVNGALRTPAVAASMVMLRDVTHLAGLRSDQTTGPYTASVRLAATLGAPAAGALITLIGAPGVLVVDAATFLISAIVVVLLVPVASPDPSDTAAVADHAGKSSLTAGFAVLRRDRLLVTLTLFAVVLAVMTGGWNSVGAPLYGKTVLSSPLQLGMVLGAFGAGALLGNLIHTPLSRRLSRYALLIAALTSAGPLPWLALASHPPLIVLLAAMTLAGVGLGVLGPFYLSLQYERIPRDHQPYLFGVTFGLQTAGEALGAASAALTFTYLTTQQALLGMGVVTATLVLIAVGTPSLLLLRIRDHGQRRSTGPGS